MRMLRLLALALVVALPAAAAMSQERFRVATTFAVMGIVFFGMFGLEVWKRRVAPEGTAGP